MDKVKNQIRPIYGELRGYLSVAPERENIYNETATNLSRQVNSTIDELNLVSDKNYDKFKVHTNHQQLNGSYRTVLQSLDYRTKLSGLISKLQGEFFSDEQTLPTGPSTVIHTTQNQSQNQQQSVVVDLAMLVAEKRVAYPSGTPERNFLDKLGEALKASKGIQEILQSIFSIATSTGIGFEALKKIFGF
ncbi:MAG: hypothetical protein A3J58_01075 [Candidatus Sungbacteria bacterium RIFCSPHIGHO2_02_FULL_52_23]|uniref:Uncharacterized protein n=1 Tax=Candidatus Sungbacteria bacterium RIFCSPHIGHO2_02_FULL_52_23 TaxID=1802274 RepID=A0A1G2L0F9_9BACT|nr:MAG: hypothetical protein A3J58_01075 [Candidatus Sungbacteria bacterium RIFCSPHIGHO2_02_FULL_52_23]